MHCKVVFFFMICYSAYLIVCITVLLILIINAYRILIYSSRCVLDILSSSKYIWQFLFQFDYVICLSFCVN